MSKKYKGGAVFEDTSGLPKSLKKRIIAVQDEPEPTQEEYFYGPVKPNYRRNAYVQEQQIPVSQADDEYTEQGQRRKEAEAEADKLEKEFKLFKTEEEKEPGFLDNLFKLLPSAAALNLAFAVKSGDPHKIAFAYKAVQKELENASDKPFSEEYLGQKRKGVKMRQKLAESQSKAKALKERAKPKAGPTKPRGKK